MAFTHCKPDPRRAKGIHAGGCQTPVFCAERGECYYGVGQEPNTLPPMIQEPLTREEVEALAELPRSGRFGEIPMAEKQVQRLCDMAQAYHSVADTIEALRAQVEELTRAQRPPAPLNWGAALRAESRRADAAEAGLATARRDERERIAGLIEVEHVSISPMVVAEYIRALHDPLPAEGREPSPSNEIEERDDDFGRA